MSRRTTREKLIAYLSEEAKRQNSSEFSIPFNRQQLADYLNARVFAGAEGSCMQPDTGDAAGFAAYMEKYRAGLAAEEAAVAAIR